MLDLRCQIFGRTTLHWTQSTRIFSFELLRKFHGKGTTANCFTESVRKLEIKISQPETSNFSASSSTSRRKRDTGVSKNWSIISLARTPRCWKESTMRSSKSKDQYNLTP
jgi:hypothetical protein